MSLRESSQSRQRGFVLPLVVFLIVVLGGAVVAIGQLTSDTSATNNQLLQQARARFLARAGIEIAVQRLVILQDESDCQTLEDNTYDDFPGLELTLDCTRRNYSEEGIMLWDITATAESNGLSPDQEEYVWQRQRATVEFPQ